MTIHIKKRHLAVVIIAVALIVPATAFATHVFDDVDDSRFFAEPVEWAKANSLTTGSPAGASTFKPFDSVTRGENITFQYRYDQNIVQPGLEGLANDIALNSSDIADNAADIDALEAADNLTHGEIVLQHATSQATPNNAAPATVTYWSSGVTVSDGAAQVSFTGPAILGGVDYGLKSVEYCISDVSGTAVTTAEIWAGDDLGSSNVANDFTDRTTAGCFEVTVNSDRQNFDLVLITDPGGSFRWRGATTTWAPLADLGLALVASPTGSNSDG